MFGKLRLIGRGAHAAKAAQPAQGPTPAGHPFAPATPQAPTLEKLAIPKALAARLLANQPAWRNAVPRLETPAADNAPSVPHRATQEP